MKTRIFAAALLILLLTGCSEDPPSDIFTSSPTPGETPVQRQTPDAAPSECPVPAGPEGSLFQAYGQDIYVCSPAAPILAALPAPDDIFEAPSCAFDGVDITYFFKGFELTTYPYNGEEYVLSVMLTDDSVTTPGGVYLGGTLPDIERAYGTDYAQNGSQYIFTNGRGSLIFTLDGGHIIGIFYTFIV
jgi:hypothetical protein